MNRQQVIAKIQSILKIQNGTDFDGECQNAAQMIDKLCKKYGITLQEATEVIVHDEVFSTFKKIDTSYATLLNAVASFYDAKAYLKNGGGEKSYNIIGSEAQQIQVNIYFEFLLGVMNRECEIAYKGEKVLADLLGTEVNRSFKTNFKKAFATKVQDRLFEMKKEENRVHEDREAVEKALSKIRFGSTRKLGGGSGAGATIGANVGGNVSLNRQASGNSCKQICGA